MIIGVITFLIAIIYFIYLIVSLYMKDPAKGEGDV